MLFYLLQCPKDSWYAFGTHHYATYDKRILFISKYSASLFVSCLADVIADHTDQRLVEGVYLQLTNPKSIVDMPYTFDLFSGFVSETEGTK